MGRGDTMIMRVVFLEQVLSVALWMNFSKCGKLDHIIHGSGERHLQFSPGQKKKNTPYWVKTMISPHCIMETKAQRNLITSPNHMTIK